MVRDKNFTQDYAQAIDADVDAVDWWVLRNYNLYKQNAQTLHYVRTERK